MAAATVWTSSGNAAAVTVGNLKQRRGKAPISAASPGSYPDLVRTSEFCTWNSADSRVRTLGVHLRSQTLFKLGEGAVWLVRDSLQPQLVQTYDFVNGLRFTGKMPAVQLIEDQQ
jgi:hypothetical protein